MDFSLFIHINLYQTQGKKIFEKLNNRLTAFYLELKYVF